MLDNEELIEDFDLETAGDEVAWADEEQEMFEHFRFEIDKGQAPMRVDKYLATHMEYTSRHRIQCAIKQDYVRVNDKVAKANCVIRPGDVVTFGRRPSGARQAGRDGRPPRARAFFRDFGQCTRISPRDKPGT